MTHLHPTTTGPMGWSHVFARGLRSAVAVAVAFTGVGALLAPVSAVADTRCDWDHVWPAEGSGPVSPYRDSFYLRGRPSCGVMDPRLVRPDGSVVPIIGWATEVSWYVELRADPYGPQLDLEPETEYTIEFSWYHTSYWDNLDLAPLTPARPYTFRTGPATDGDQPLTLDDLVVNRFEISRNARLVTLEAAWPDPSPLYRMEFQIPAVSGNPLHRRTVLVFPAAEDDDLSRVFDAGRTRGSDQTCASLRVVADSVLGGETATFSDCAPGRCTSVQAAPSLVGLGVLALLLAGRRRRAASSLPR